MSQGKFHHRTDHKGLEGMQRYCYTLSLTSALDEVGWLTPCSGHFNPGKKTRYPFNRSLGGSRGRLDGCGRYCCHRDSIPGPSSPQRVAVPTLSRPTTLNECRYDISPLKPCGLVYLRHQEICINFFPLLISPSVGGFTFRLLMLKTISTLCRVWF